MGTCPWNIVTAGQVFTDFITTIIIVTMDLVMTILATVMLTTGSAIDLDRSRAVEGFLGQLEDKLSEPSSKIVGGVTAHEGQFPFIVSLKIYNFHRYLHFCGGSAISTSHIITAAHCVDVRFFFLSDKLYHIFSHTVSYYFLSAILYHIISYQIFCITLFLIRNSESYYLFSDILYYVFISYQIYCVMMFLIRYTVLYHFLIDLLYNNISYHIYCIIVFLIIYTVLY